MTCSSVQILDDETLADEAIVRLQCISACGSKPAVGAGVFIDESLGDDKPLTTDDGECGDDYEPEIPDFATDQHVDFSVHAGKWSPRPPTPWLRHLLGATAVSWGLSILAHGAIVVVAMALLQLADVTRPASIDFSYGDGSPEVGLKDRPGTPDLTPGWEGLASTLPNGAPNAALPSLERPTEADAVLEEKSSEPPPPPQVEDPPPLVETRISEESAVQNPLPKFASSLQVPEPQTPASAEPTDIAPMAPPAPHAEAASGSAVPATPPAQKTADNMAGNSAPAGPAGGDGTAGGQGGTASGAGGFAATGDPGIPAGLRDGQNLPTPIYPEICRRRGEKGEVRLQIEVLADGSLGEVRIETDAGFPRLAEAAISSLRGYKFRPALMDGQAVRSTLIVPFRFNLR